MDFTHQERTCNCYLSRNYTLHQIKRLLIAHSCIREHLHRSRYDQQRELHGVYFAPARLLRGECVQIELVCVFVERLDDMFEIIIRHRIHLQFSCDVCCPLFIARPHMSVHLKLLSSRRISGVKCVTCVSRFRVNARQYSFHDLVPRLALIDAIQGRVFKFLSPIFAFEFILVLAFGPYVPGLKPIFYLTDSLVGDITVCLCEGMVAVDTTEIHEDHSLHRQGPSQWEVYNVRASCANIFSVIPLCLQRFHLGLQFLYLTFSFVVLCLHFIDIAFHSFYVLLFQVYSLLPLLFDFAPDVGDILCHLFVGRPFEYTP